MNGTKSLARIDKMKSLSLLFLLLSAPAMASENGPPNRPAQIDPVEDECEIAFPMVVNRKVPSFFLNDDGTFKCNALLVPRSQAGNAILMAEWAENLNEWYQLDIEVRNAEIRSIQSSHRLEVEKVRKNARKEGMALGAGIVTTVVLVLALSL